VIPLAADPLTTNGTWIQGIDKSYGGPFLRYFSDLGDYCGYPNIFSYQNITWVGTSREAEWRMFSSGNFDVALPIARRYTLSDMNGDKNARGDVFVPIITSPGTTMLTIDNYSPTTISAALFSREIIVVLVVLLSLSVLTGIAIWLSDRHHRKSNFPPDFINGAGIGFWWALVTVATVGYGDRVPKTKIGRGIAILWILVGIMILALVQGTVLEKLSTGSTDIILEQLVNNIDNVYGFNVGVLKDTIDEWHIRSRGAHATSFPSLPDAITALESSSDPLNSIAVDTLASAVAVNVYANKPVTPTGRLAESITFGLQLSASVASMPTTSAAKFAAANLTLGECMRQVALGGPDQLYPPVYFREYTEMAYGANLNQADREQQESAFAEGQLVSAILLPLLAACAVLIGWYWDRRFGRPQRYKQWEAEHPGQPLPPHALDTHLSDSAEVRAGYRTEGTITRTRAEYLRERGEDMEEEDDDDSSLLNAPDRESARSEA
jgi:hypothetical protein